MYLIGTLKGSHDYAYILYDIKKGRDTSEGSLPFFRFNIDYLTSIFSPFTIYMPFLSSFTAERSVLSNTFTPCRL